jgi:hypothetical protein
MKNCQVLFRAAWRPVSVCVLSAIMLAFSCAPAHAVGPTADDSGSGPDIPGGPSVQFIGSETGDYESNPLMLNGGGRMIYGSVTTPEIVFNGKTPTELLNVDALVNENVFNLSNFDSTDVHGKVNYTDKSEQWLFTLKQNTDYDTTRTSELFPTAFNGSLSTVPVRHLGLSLAPEVDYNATAIDKISLAGSIQDSQFENPIFVNYGQAVITPGYTHEFDPLNSGTFNVQFQRYETTSGPQVYSDSVAPQIGWISKLTPRLTGQVSAGIQASRQYGSGAIQVPWQLNYVFAADLGFKGQQDNTHFNAARNDYPFGNGTDSLLTTYSITETHDINPLFSVNVGASYQTATYQSTATGDLDYLLTGSGGLTYHATERLDIAATYQYRRETLISTPGNATDNMATLGVVYHPLAWHL